MSGTQRDSFTVSDSARFDFVVIILALLTAFAPLSIDMYLPAFTAIAADYQTDTHRVELSLSAFFFGLFIGQHASIQIGVNSHLFAGHGVERKAG